MREFKYVRGLFSSEHKAERKIGRPTSAALTGTGTEITDRQETWGGREREHVHNIHLTFDRFSDLQRLVATAVSFMLQYQWIIY